MKIRKSRIRNIICVCLTCVMLVSSQSKAYTYESNQTRIKYEVKAAGEYDNWEGVSNVSQFVDDEGNFCFAYDSGKYVKIVKTIEGKISGKAIKIKKKCPEFGGVACDEDGNYYIVTGTVNDSDDTSKDTIYISKYNSKGKHITSIGDVGNSSLGDWYDDSFYTKEPFRGGNCDIAINNRILAINYSRGMYSGHQSNSVFAIDIDTMQKVNLGNIYSSHSFGQRAVGYGEGFAFLSEGDCFSRAFEIDVANAESGVKVSKEIFDFWVKKGAFDEYNMYVVNNNFAHIGGLANINDKYLALVGSSVKSLSSKAKKENEQVFIQIFNPDKDLSSPDAYVTKGKRAGLAGNNGDQYVINYGVKWLTNVSKKNYISHPQVVATDNGRIIVLYELYGKSGYKGIYCIELDSKGKIKTKGRKISGDMKLNPCETPIYSDGNVYWVSNKLNDRSNRLFLNMIKV